MKVDLRGTEYYVDENLEQLINVDDEDDIIEFDDITAEMKSDMEPIVETEDVIHLFKKIN